MVLEHILPDEVVERKLLFAFLLGVFYSIVGIILARYLFASDPALAAIAFTSILLLPQMYKLFDIEERQQRKNKRTGLGVVWRDNRDFFQVFFCIFFGILLVYSLAAIMLPTFSVGTLFREQLAMRGIHGQAISTEPLFMRLLANNALVLTAIFVVAFLAGDGALFLITWNASLWGAIFGFTARLAATVSSQNPFVTFGQIVLIVTPHVLIEATSYILAAMAGGLLSHALLRQKMRGKELEKVLIDNFVILAVAIAALFLGALVEAIVLQTNTTYAEIIRRSILALRF